MPRLQNHETATSGDRRIAADTWKDRLQEVRENPASRSIYRERPSAEPDKEKPRADKRKAS